MFNGLEKTIPNDTEAKLFAKNPKVDECLSFVVEKNNKHTSCVDEGLAKLGYADKIDCILEHDTNSICVGDRLEKEHDLYGSCDETPGLDSNDVFAYCIFD